ncbi:Rrf2 family transcriptional regulator [Pontibacter brevis]
MLSKKAKYALKALLHLTRQHNKGLVVISDIAEKERIPRKFLEAILVDLKTNGVLHSVRGKNGGYSLAKSPSEISVGNVIRMIDGPLAPIPCVSHLYYRKCDECKDEATCEIRIVMKKVRDATAEILDNTFLNNLEALSTLLVEEEQVSTDNTNTTA